MFRPLRNRARAARAQAASPLSAGQIEVLAKANDLVKNGQSGQAAPLFAELARELENTQHPRAAANLHAQAAHAFANANDAQGSLLHARAALTLFIQNRMLVRAPTFYNNIIRKLSNKGLQAAADTLKNEFGGQIGKLPTPRQGTGPSPAAQPGKLPGSCPKCGAPVHGSASVGEELECDYCGTAIRAE